MSHMTNDFDFTAVDISPAMIEQAKKLNPGVEFHVGDMRTVRLEQTFDGVLVHDAISHMLTEEDLRDVLATARVHLRNGGIFITAPDWFLETFREPQIECQTNTDGETEFTYFEYIYDPDPSDTMIEILLWYLIRRGQQAPQVEYDRMICGLFSLATWEQLITEAGFHVEKLSYNVQKHKSYFLIGMRQE